MLIRRWSFQKEQGCSQERIIVFVNFVSARKFEGYDLFDGTCVELQFSIICQKLIACKFNPWSLIYILY
jgi:hypothetical protein